MIKLNWICSACLNFSYESRNKFKSDPVLIFPWLLSCNIGTALKVGQTWVGEYGCEGEPII